MRLGKGYSAVLDVKEKVQCLNRAVEFSGGSDPVGSLMRVDIGSVQGYDLRSLP